MFRGLDRGVGTIISQKHEHQFKHAFKSGMHRDVLLDSGLEHLIKQISQTATVKLIWGINFFSVIVDKLPTDPLDITLNACKFDMHTPHLKSR